MTIKINEKMICIPSYISTSWSRISCLHMKETILCITLIDGEVLQIPDLSKESIDLIFQYHSEYLDKDIQSPLDAFSEKGFDEFQEILDGIKGESAVRLSFNPSLEKLGVIMSHNPEQFDAPDLPPEILQKIGMISKILAPSDEMIIPAAEEGCNCFHCQISRALNPHHTLNVTKEAELIEEEVSEAELQFQQWDIEQIGDQLFTVTNRLDSFEKYNVYLGDPVGCTCGKNGCDHIPAVLKS
ncbi:MAG: hypothetical protein Q8K60_00520 [Parachlamydiaceae bacterium]|nr:hypothetical protein [Parachlamydiaceae bacterium]